MADSEPMSYEPEEEGDLPMPEIPSWLQRQVIVTTDNASNISKAIDDSEMIHILCFAHTINLAAQKFVKAVDAQTARIRSIANFFHRSSGATAHLKVSKSHSSVLEF